MNIKEIAELAGVSKSTVLRALNNSSLTTSALFTKIKIKFSFSWALQFFYYVGGNSFFNF